jgi:hypothetical protein
MITEKLINEIVTKRGLTKMSISSFPTWINKNKQEGIEFKTGKVIPFWINAGERKYDQPVSEPLTKTIELINTANNEPIETPQEKKEQPKKDTKELVDKQPLLPDFLTPALMTKWALMSTTDRILLFQQTPKDKIKQVEVGTDKNGKKIYAPYVEGNYMFKEANASFLFDWHITIQEITTSETGVSVRGTLYGYFKEYEKYLSRPATGYQELNKKVDKQLAVKGATTDAIKKGLSLFGFNSDVYSGEL